MAFTIEYPVTIYFFAAGVWQPHAPKHIAVNTMPPMFPNTDQQTSLSYFGPREEYVELAVL